MGKESAESLARRRQLKKEIWLAHKDDDFPHSIMKRCKDCGKMKPCLWTHSFTCTGKPEYYAACEECRKIRRDTKKQNWMITRLDYRKARAWHSKCLLIDKMGGKCAHCGETDKVVLTFHHKDPSEKVCNISKLLNNGASINNKKLQEETKKCIVLCLNCHMKLDWQSRRIASENFFKTIKQNELKWS